MRKIDKLLIIQGDIFTQIHRRVEGDFEHKMKSDYFKKNPIF